MLRIVLGIIALFCCSYWRNDHFRNSQWVNFPLQWRMVGLLHMSSKFVLWICIRLVLNDFNLILHLILFFVPYRIRYLLIARMLRLIRLLMHVPQYRAFVATFLTLLPSLMPYLGTIFCVLCIYCSIGVQVIDCFLRLYFLFQFHTNESSNRFLTL